MVSRLTRHIEKEQSSDGSFSSLSSPSESFSTARTYSTTFFTSVILLCLKDNPDTYTQDVVSRGITFLQSQLSDNATYNYWNSSIHEYRDSPYPDDADDTFLSLSALQMYDPSFMTGEHYAKITHGLTAIESAPGGPYYTWYTNDPAWKDIDIAVNANIYSFLRLVDVELDELREYIESCIKHDTLTSRYYPSDMHTIYWIARNYSGKHRQALIHALIKHQTKSGLWDNILLDAINTSSLIRLGAPKETYMRSLDLISNLRETDMQPYRFCIDPSMKGKTYYAGSSALTAALCVEAINLSTKKEEPVHLQHQLHNRIKNEVESTINSFPRNLQSPPLQVLEMLMSDEHAESIVLLPSIFHSSTHLNVNIHLVNKLSVAHVLGWIAYTLYDDVLDKDADVETLLCANACLRELDEIYFTQTSQSFHSEYMRIMNLIDSANTLEIDDCRNIRKPPKYQTHEMLAHKSIGHALACLAMLHEHGLALSSREYVHTYEFFQEYIIARQLGDDAHDWKIDLEAERVTPVVASLIRLKKKHPEIPYEKIFWTMAIHTVCDDISKHIEKAHEHLSALTYLDDKALFTKLLSGIEEMVRETLNKQQVAQDYLRNID